MATLRQMAIKLIVKELEKDAKRILRECVDERTYEHDTKNLYDSYGYGIYVDGSLTRSGFLSASPQASKEKKWYGTEVHGRNEIKTFLSSYDAKGAICLVVAASMPYAVVLEQGGGGLKKKYKVISMSFQKLQDIAKKYNGAVSIL